MLHTILTLGGLFRVLGIRFKPNWNQMNYKRQSYNFQTLKTHSTPNEDKNIKP